MDELLGNPLETHGVAADGFDLIRLDPIRRMIAQRLTESARDTPHFALEMQIECGLLLDLRRTLNARVGTNTRLSVNDFIVKACALALRARPAVNASFTSAGIARYRSVDVAVAVAVDGGLITPVVRNADRKQIDELSIEIKSLAERAQRMRLKPSEYKGGSFCVSNLGMYGVTRFTSILNPPHACILSVGSVERRPVMEGNVVRGAEMATLTLNCDHRVVDGATGAQFLAEVKALLEAPETCTAA